MREGLLERRVDPAAALLLGAALALAAATRAYNLFAPFGADFEGWLAAMYGASGRNFAREGFFALGFAPHLTNGPVRLGDVTPFFHHPPFLSVVLGVSYRLFGVSEWATRLFPALAGIAGIATSFLVARRLAGPRVAGLAALVLAALPMTGIFGGLVNFEPFVLLATSSTYLFWLRWREGGRPRDLVAALALFFLAVEVDWFGIFVSVPIAAHALIVRPRARFGALVAFAAVGVLSLAATFAHYEAVHPGAIERVLHAARHRSSDAANDYFAGTYGAAEWLSRHAAYFRALFTPAALGLAAAGAIAGAFSGRAELRRAALHAVLFAVMGLLPVVIFRQASYQHSFLSFQMGPGIALGVAALVAWAWDAAARPAPRLLLRAAALAGLAALAWSAQPLTWRTLAAGHAVTVFRDRGRAIAAAVRFEDGVATPGALWEGWVTVGFYADRAIQTGVTSLPALEAARAHPPFPSAPIRHVVFTHADARAHAALAQALAERYAVRGAGDLAIFDLDAPRPR